MRVFVINKRQKPLMPCSPKKARILLKQNRKLHKGARSHIKNTAPRYIKGFKRYDKVLYNRQECFIFGRRSTGYFDLRKLDGTKIHASANYKKLKLLERATTFLIERRECHSSSSTRG